MKQLTLSARYRYMLWESFPFLFKKEEEEKKEDYGGLKC